MSPQSQMIVPTPTPSVASAATFQSVALATRLVPPCAPTPTPAPHITPTTYNPILPQHTYQQSTLLSPPPTPIPPPPVRPQVAQYPPPQTAPTYHQQVQQQVPVPPRFTPHIAAPCPVPTTYAYPNPILPTPPQPSQSQYAYTQPGPQYYCQTAPPAQAPQMAAPPATTVSHQQTGYVQPRVNEFTEVPNSLLPSNLQPVSQPPQSMQQPARQTSSRYENTSTQPTFEVHGNRSVDLGAMGDYRGTREPLLSHRPSSGLGNARDAGAWHQSNHYQSSHYSQRSVNSDPLPSARRDFNNNQFRVPKVPTVVRTHH